MVSTTGYRRSQWQGFRACAMEGVISGRIHDDVTVITEIKPCVLQIQLLDTAAEAGVF